MADWKEELDELLRQKQQRQEEQAREKQQTEKVVKQNEQKARDFVYAVPLRAFKELEKGLQERGMFTHSHIGETGTSISIEVDPQGELATEIKHFQYIINVTYDASEIVTQVVCTSCGAHPIQRDGRILNIDEIAEKDVIGDFWQAFKHSFTK